MKITKKEFVNAMTENLTVFCGRTRKLLNADEVYCAIADYFKGDSIIEKRSCEAHSNHIVFSGGSRLDLNGNKYGKYEYPEATVYYCASYSKGDTEPWVVCYYMVEN